MIGGMLRRAVCFAVCCVERNDGQHFVYHDQGGGHDVVVLCGIFC